MDIYYHNNNSDLIYLKLFCDPNIGTLIKLHISPFRMNDRYFLKRNIQPIYYKLLFLYL